MNFDGLGGLPYGTQGNVAAQIQDENDALAAWLMMRRGCTIYAAGSGEYIEILNNYSNPHINHYSSLKAAVSDSKALGILCGQTLKNIDYSLENEYKLPVFRPLVGLNRKQSDAFKALMRQF